MARTLLWFREHDLRLRDHQALRAALGTGQVVPVFVLEPGTFSRNKARERAHRTQFVVDSLLALEEALAARGSGLVVVAGRGVEAVLRLMNDWRADRVVATRASEPIGRGQDAQLCLALGERAGLYPGETLHTPGTLRTGGGTPYAVFTAFARAFTRAVEPGRVWPAPRSLPSISHGLGLSRLTLPALESLGVTRNPRVVRGGEGAARERLRRFLREGLGGYSEQRNRMDLQGTSRLSADLARGTLSAREVWLEVERAGEGSRAATCFLNELVWREFAKSTLWDRPDVLERPFKPAFEGFPWREDEAHWRAWVRGDTGYPIVDAAARQLLGEGFVHNRARMIAASFLTKHLLLDYRRGEAHYLRYLVDADLANNDLGWQWSAGCGCDAQPYYRVFNPVIQGERFDPNGDYVRRWVPELRRMPARFIHRPWEASAGVLRSAAVSLGRNYPEPIVEHRLVHERFLELARRHLKGRAARGEPEA